MPALLPKLSLIRTTVLEPEDFSTGKMPVPHRSGRFFARVLAGLAPGGFFARV